MYVKKKKINITISWNNAKNDGLWSCYKRKQKNYSNWPQIPDHPYKILITGDSRYGKTNYISHQSDIDTIYLHAKDPYEQTINCKLTQEKVPT